MSDYRELSAKVVIVRKPHSCGWCAHRIEVGEHANFRSYVFDGDLQSDWMHPECQQAMAAYPDYEDLRDGWTPGTFARGSVLEAA
jgi:hypothetical protein